MVNSRIIHNHNSEAKLARLLFAQTLFFNNLAYPIGEDLSFDFVVKTRGGNKVSFYTTKQYSLPFHNHPHSFF